MAAVQKRQGLYISCVEEIAYHKKFIDKEQLLKIPPGVIITFSALQKIPFCFVSYSAIFSRSSKPNNPTGRILRQEESEELLALVKQHQIYLLSGA